MKQKYDKALPVLLVVISALVVAPALVSVAPGFELIIRFCCEVRLGSFSMNGFTTFPVRFCIRGFVEGLIEP